MKRFLNRKKVLALLLLPLFVLGCKSSNGDSESMKETANGEYAEKNANCAEMLAQIQEKEAAYKVNMPNWTATVQEVL